MSAPSSTLLRLLETARALSEMQQRQVIFARAAQEKFPTASTVPQLAIIIIICKFKSLAILTKLQMVNVFYD